MTKASRTLCLFICALIVLAGSTGCKEEIPTAKPTSAITPTPDATVKSTETPTPLSTQTLGGASIYLLHVEGPNIERIPIKYSGDYSGTHETPFDIGPKTSPFTVTLEAVLGVAGGSDGGLAFLAWYLDGRLQTRSKLLIVTVDDKDKERTALAMYEGYGLTSSPEPAPIMTPAPTPTSAPTPPLTPTAMQGATFSGSVAVAGQPVAGGTVITANAYSPDGTTFWAGPWQTSVSSNSVYSITIPADDPATTDHEGAPEFGRILFQIGYLNADGFATFYHGGGVIFSLSALTPPNFTPTPEPAPPST